MPVSNLIAKSLHLWGDTDQLEQPAGLRRFLWGESPWRFLRCSRGYLLLRNEYPVSTERFNLEPRYMVVNLTGANLTNATFREVRLTGANLTDAVVTGARL